jgi:hypothetical protein
MTTNESASQPRLSTDLEMLHARVKGKSLTLAELKQSLKGRGSAMLLILLALPFCFIAIPGLSTPFGIAICLIGACLVIGREPWLPRFIMRLRLSTTRLAQLLTGAIKVARQLETFVRPRLAFLHAGPGMLRLIGFGIVSRSRIDAAIANSVFEQHSSLGGSASGHRNDGEGRLVRVARPSNCDIYLGLYCSDLSVRRWRFPEAFGFFSGLMKIHFICALTSRTQFPHRNGYVVLTLGSGTLFAAFKIRLS